MKCLPLLLLAVLLASCSSSSLPPPSLSPVSFSSPKLPPPGGLPNIFKEYSTTGDSVMMRGWSRNFDMSGVSFDIRQACTLVTKRHVVMAKHFRRGPGKQVIFHDRNGKRLERKIMAIKNLPGDVTVGLLNREVPSSYKVYPLPAPREDYSSLVGRYAAVTDQHRRIFFHQVRSLGQQRISFRHVTPRQHGWGKKLIKGDSGNPSFIISGNELVLVETHTTGGGGGGPFYGSPALQEKLQEAITALAPGYAIRFKNL